RAARRGAGDPGPRRPDGAEPTGMTTAVSKAMFRYGVALAVLAAGVVLAVAAAPRFIGGAAMAPYEDILRSTARGGKTPTAPALDAAREGARVSLAWFDYNRTRLRLGAFELVGAGLATTPNARRAALDRSIGSLRAGLARAPGDAYGWLQLAQALRVRDGATADLEAALRMSLRTAPYEHRLIVPRIEIAFGAWAALAPDLRAAFRPQIVRAVDTAPVQLARATRRYFALRQVREALAGSPVHMERFNIVYLTPD
ncbi:MAG: hypothetical protein WD470_09810, partial [Rhodospirillaceae bacterium]